MQILYANRLQINSPTEFDRNFFASRDSLEPILEKYNITFESHSVFLDSSHTPLPLAFETFPLSGSILHVRGKSFKNC